jgi:ribonuclease Z
LLNEPELLDGVRRLDVVLTHFHLDHLIGLFYVADLEQPPDVWGAGEALEGIATAKLVDRLLDSPLAPPSFRDRLAVHELEIGGSEIGAFSVRTRIQHLHVNSTLALRIDDAIVWCTDTAYDPESADFIRGARVFCHEAFYAAEHTDDSGHTAAGEAARLAAAAEVERLVLIHIHPDLHDDEALLSFARTHFAETVVGVDGLEVD